MARAWAQRYQRHVYRLIRPLSFTSVDAAEWMLSLQDDAGCRVWLRLRGQSLGDEGRQHIAMHWHWLRYAFAPEIHERGRLIL